MNEVTEAMLLIRSLDPTAHVSMDINDKWYVVANIMKGDVSLTSYTSGAIPRQDSPDHAVIGYAQYLKLHKKNEYWHVRVYDMERDYQWNGVAFCEKHFMNA